MSQVVLSIVCMLSGRHVQTSPGWALGSSRRSGIPTTIDCHTTSTPHYCCCCNVAAVCFGLPTPVLTTNSCNDTNTSPHHNLLQRHQHHSSSRSTATSPPPLPPTAELGAPQASLLTILVYLNDDFRGGETVSAHTIWSTVVA